MSQKWAKVYLGNVIYPSEDGFTLFSFPFTLFGGFMDSPGYILADF
jgi:hypothetical protein